MESTELPQGTTNGSTNGFDKGYDYQSYLDNEDFQDFMRAAAQEFLDESSIEELAEIVFGDLDEAIEAFHEGYDVDEDDEDTDDDEDEEDE
jgi:hypothetical protein